MKKYRILDIISSNINLDDYNGPFKEIYIEDSKEFPYLREYVEDEVETFIMNEGGQFWPVCDFIEAVGRNKEFYTED